ncbi:cytochrome P450 3A14-like isoform X1 [Amblyomma americanum]
MFLLVAAVSVLGVFVVALFRWRQRHFSYFKALGIPGPTPSLLWGNILEYHETDHFKVLDKWFKKYGDTFGFYDGDVPFIVTKDLDFLEYVLVRNFQSFTDRGMAMVMEKNHPLLKNGIVHASGMQWRSLRRAIAPGFTPAKLKQMLAELKIGADIFLDIVGKLADSGQEANVYHLYQRLAMDYVGRGALGIDCSFQKGPENALAATAKVILRGVMTGPFHLICQSTSMLQPLMKPLYWMNMLLGAYVAIAFTKETAKMIQLRRNNPEYRKPGILQNLLDAEYREDCNAVNNDPVDISKTSAGASKSRMLTTDEVLLSASSLFIAGYDTTSTSLSYITYLLAKHQDVQSKVRKEVNNAVFSNANFEYEAVTRKLPYLSQVVNEALRLYPPVLVFITRTAVSDFEYNGVKYKAGTCVMSPTLQIHRDARYWPDPLTFDPDRFSPDNEGTFHKVAHQPFGVGPRNCVGMRMAQVTLNFTIARLLQRFHLELGPSQGEGSLDIGSRSIVSEPSNGPWIVFRRLSTPHHERVKQAVDS